MKKYLPFIIAGAVILLGLILLMVFKNRQASQPKTVQDQSQQVVLPIEERPYVNLTPRADGHELKLDIENLSGVKTVEYELVYLAGDVQRGVIGSVDLGAEKTISRNLLLGSCSKNVCKYDENVQEGTLTLRLRGDKAQKYDLAFRLQTGDEAKEGLTSADGNLQFKGNLAKNAFYLTMETGGLPKKPQAKIVAGPYAILTPTSSQVKGTLKVGTKEIPAGAKILGWDQTTKAWKEFSRVLEASSQAVTVEADRLTTFIVVSP